VTEAADDRPPPLAVRVSTVPGAAIVAAAGDLDMGTAPTLRTHARHALDGRPDAFIVDLDGITFCGSAGLQVLAELAHTAAAANLPFAVVATRHPVLRALEVTGLDATLTLHATVDSARAWVGRPCGR
jgi:anti-anti-sigma factor